MANDPDECPCSWMDKAKAIVLVIGAIGGLIASSIAAYFGVANHGQNQVNAQKLDEAATIAVETKETVDTKAAKVDRTLTKLSEANLPNLYASLLYFENVSKDEERTPAERDKARIKAQETRNAISTIERGIK